MYFILPFVIIYPFAASNLNAISTGDKIERIKDFVDTAYLISLLGYFSMYIGYYLYNVFKRNSLLYFFSVKINGKLSWFLYKSIISKYANNMLAFIGFALIFLLYSIVISKYGFNTNFRHYMLSDGGLRPLFNFTISYVSIIITIFLIRYLDSKNKRFLVISIAFAGFMMLTGSRAAATFPILVAYIFYVIARRRRINLVNVVITGFVFTFVILFLGQLRNGNIDLLSLFSSIWVKIFYGNNFSDLRDFAWILSYWDGVLVSGKTYTAALMSFIPRDMSLFRSEWALSVYTNSLVGFNSNEHAGLRPGIFGEAYLNFGILGVMILGYLSGFILKFTDEQIKRSLNNEMNFARMYSHSIIFMFLSNFFITASFWKFYILLFIVSLGFLIHEITKKPKNVR
jgi:oligosaccharide repeat unit polymerase